jgi:hypothetical protein
MNTAKIYACEACYKFRDEADVFHDTEGRGTFCESGLCDTPSPYEACEGCDEIDLAENLINGGEYEPDTYRCHDCEISHLEALREARLQELDYRRNN